jgi:hypothetical protein
MKSVEREIGGADRKGRREGIEEVCAKFAHTAGDGKVYAAIYP